MSAAKVQFRCGARVIPAPLPQGDLDANVKHLMTAFPFFRALKPLFYLEA